MADLDFSKIFGETATSKAEFTNENYLKGWGYLGSTPPPYQLFDYLQSQNDKKAKFLYDKVMSYDGQYVPLSGGTMTGNLAINNGTEFSAIELNNTTNGKLLLESMAQNSDSVGHIIYRNGSDTQAKLNIPKKTGTLATLADVPAPVDLDSHKNAAIIDHPDQSVVTDKIRDLNVTTIKLADKSVTVNKIADDLKEYINNILRWKKITMAAASRGDKFGGTIEFVDLPTYWTELKIFVEWNNPAPDISNYGWMQGSPTGGYSADINDVNMATSGTYILTGKDAEQISISVDKVKMTGFGRNGDDCIVGVYYR